MANRRWQFCISASDHGLLDHLVEIGLGRSRAAAFRSAIIMACSDTNKAKHARIAIDCREVRKARGVAVQAARRGKANHDRLDVVDGRVSKWTVRLGVVYFVRLQQIMERHGFTAMAEAGRFAIRLVAATYRPNSDRCRHGPK